MGVIDPVLLQNGRAVDLYPKNHVRTIRPTIIMPTVNPNQGDTMYDLQQVNAKTFSTFPETRVFEWRLSKDSILKRIKISSPQNVIGDITFDVKVGDDISSVVSIFADPEDRPVLATGTQIIEIPDLDIEISEDKLVSIDIVSGNGALSYLSATAYFEKA